MTRGKLEITKQSWNGKYQIIVGSGPYRHVACRDIPIDGLVMLRAEIARAINKAQLEYWGNKATGDH